MNMNRIKKIQLEKNLTEYYSRLKVKFLEGHCGDSEEQKKRLIKIILENNVKNVLEIGFNAGHSSEIFLSQDTEVTSFDLGCYEYTKIGKKFLDKKFPGKHQLILGNSLETVPKFTSDKKFDLIFIDGGHQYEIAMSDLLNCKKFSHKKTIIVLDDTISKNEWIEFWNHGPNKVWDEAKNKKIIRELGSEDYKKGKGQSWGYYNL